MFVLVGASSCNGQFRWCAALFCKLVVVLLFAYCWTSKVLCIPVYDDCPSTVTTLVAVKVFVNKKTSKVSVASTCWSCCSRKTVTYLVNNGRSHQRRPRKHGLHRRQLKRATSLCVAADPVRFWSRTFRFLRTRKTLAGVALESGHAKDVLLKFSA